MAGAIQGWAIMAGGQDDSGDISYEDVEEALTSSDPKKLKETLEVIGGKGELGAAELGYSDLVVAILDTQYTEVTVAALDAFGKMGSIGAWYAEAIASCLGFGDPQVQAAAATALGNFGKQVAMYKDQLVQLAKGGQDEMAKTAAITALGKIGAEEEVEALAEMVESSSPITAAAACQALGLLGAAGEKKADLIASKLDDPSIKYAALCALKNFGGSVVCNSIDKIIYQCLADKDLGTRQLAGIALGTAADDVLSSEIHMQKITNLLGSQEPGSRCAAAQALGHLGEKAVDKWAAKLEDLLSDEQEDLSSRSMQMGGTFGRASAAMRKPQCAAISALGMMGASTYTGMIATKLNSDDWEVRLCALQSLASIGEAAATEEDKIVELLSDDVYLNRAEACKTLAAIEAGDSAEEIKAALQDKSPSVCVAAALALGQLGPAGASFSNEVFKLLKSPLKHVRVAAISSLGNMEEIGECYAGPIATFLEDASVQVRCASIEALGKLGSRGAAFAEEVALFLEDPVWMVRVAAVKALSQMGEEAEAYLPRLKQLTHDPLLSEVAKEAVEAIA